MTLSGMPSPVPFTDDGISSLISAPQQTDGIADLPIILDHINVSYCVRI